jgi:hypothetical protein
MNPGIVVMDPGVVVMKKGFTQEAPPKEVTSSTHGVTNQDGTAMIPGVHITGTRVP